MENKIERMIEIKLTESLPSAREIDQIFKIVNNIGYSSLLGVVIAHAENTLKKLDNVDQSRIRKFISSLRIAAEKAIGIDYF